MRIVVIEDDAVLAQFICKGLKEEQYAVDCHKRNGIDKGSIVTLTLHAMKLLTHEVVFMQSSRHLCV